MNTSKPSAARRFVLAAAIIVATLGLTPAFAWAQQVAPPPAPQPPRAGADVRPSDGAGWLGITMSEVTPEKAQEVRLNDVHGVVVTGVSENSPAAKAGLAGSDIITDFRGQRVEGTLALARLVRETPPGRVVQLRVWREGRSRDMSVEIGRAPGPFSGDLLPPDWRDRVLQFQERLQRRLEGRDGPRPGAAGAPVLGINVQDVSGQLGAYLKVPEGQGVLITNVQAGSAAERGGLQAGDVIIAVDGQRVRNTAELRAQVRATAETRTAALRVVRNGVETTVNVEVSAAPRPGARAGERPAISI